MNDYFTFDFPKMESVAKNIILPLSWVLLGRVLTELELRDSLLLFRF
jgi:hypothetical protein